MGWLRWYYRARLRSVQGVDATAWQLASCALCHWVLERQSLGIWLPTSRMNSSLFFFRLAQFCFELCRNVETKYMMLLDGDLCGCGDIKGFLSLNNEATSCDVQCVGDDGNSCGGVTELDVFKFFFYGASTKIQSPYALCLLWRASLAQKGRTTSAAYAS